MYKRQLEPILAEHPFLKGMKKEHLALITGCASNVKWDAGTYLFKEGQDADQFYICLLYTSDAADERSSVDLGGRRIIKKKK